MKGWRCMPCHKCVGHRAALGVDILEYEIKFRLGGKCLDPYPLCYTKAPILLKNYFYFMCMDVLFACLCAMCVTCPRRPEEALDLLTQQLQMLMSCDESGPLEEQAVLLPTGPSHQLPDTVF